jgi:hypothetical protein
MAAFESFMPLDGGPIYAETPHELAAGQWLIEPWNAISSLLIIAPAIYFLIHAWGSLRKNLFLALCIPLLLLGGTGSTLFHAFRIEPLFLSLDVWPTALLFLAVSAYFWAKVFGNWWMALLVMGLVVVFTLGIYQWFPISFRTNWAYFLRGLAFFLPMVITLLRTRFREGGWIIFGLVAFGLALLFRYLDHDATTILPMGSHFLWHVFTGLGGFLIAEYLLRVDAKGEAIT